MREKTRARILLLSDLNREQGSLSVEAICEQLRTSPATVTRVKKVFLARGLEGIKRKEQAKRKARVIDGEMEAFLIATVCSAAPKGRKRWTLELVKDKLIVAGYVDDISKETIRQALKKMNLNLG
jgi:DNA-binding MarR family transcriptional regulator